MAINTHRVKVNNKLPTEILGARNLTGYRVDQDKFVKEVVADTFVRPQD